MTQFLKWPSISKFSDVYHSASRYDIQTVQFKGKIKLHGTNAAIRLDNGMLTAQSRTRDLDVETDNAGFAIWLQGQPVANTTEYDRHIFYGEWAGPGVKGGDAVSGIASNMFFVFAVTSEQGQVVELEPENIQHMVTMVFGDNPQIHVLPWSFDAQVDMSDQKACQAFIDSIVTEVDSIAVLDPYIMSKFGVSGPGEGLVVYGLGMGEFWNQWIFKVKSQAHSVQKSRNRAHVAPEKPHGVDDFITMFFTQARFAQILNEQFADVADKKDTGSFIGAVMQDVNKESVNEMELADFDWKAVSKYAVTPVRKWFLAQGEKL